MKRYYQRKQTKCNFCMEWFSTDYILNNSIHLCDPCIEKALNSTCYKVPGPNGKEFYQLYLFRNNVKVQMPRHGLPVVVVEPVDPDSDTSLDNIKLNFIEGLDEYRNQQLKKMSKKWQQITEKVQKMAHFGEQEMKEYTEILDEYMKGYPTGKELLERNQRKIRDVAEKLKENKEAIVVPVPVLVEQNNEQNKENPADVYFLTHKSQTKPQPQPQSQKLQPQPRKSTTKTITQSTHYSTNRNIYNSPSRAPLTDININTNHSVSSNFKKSQSQVSEFSKGTKKIRDSIKKSNNNIQRIKVDSFKLEDQPQRQKSATKQNPRKRPVPQPLPYTKQKREKDLQQIASSALKQKIYTYLQTSSSVPPALYLPMTLQIYDAIQNTSTLNNCIELVSHDISELDIKCYLSMFDWTDVDCLKLVKVGLGDGQFRELLAWVKGLGKEIGKEGKEMEKGMESLVVTSNRLTEESVLLVGDMVGELVGMGLKNLYLGRNRIHKIKVKEVLKDIQNKFLLYL